MKTVDLTAYTREDTGKGPARRRRAGGFVPAVFYGPKTATRALSVPKDEMVKLLKRRGENVFIKLVIDDKGQRQEALSIIKELQVEPLGGKIQHVDFYEVTMDKKLVFEVPLHFKGKPVGVDMGGDLQHSKRELKVLCLPADLPDFFEVDVSALKIGESFKIRDIQVDEKITVVDPLDAAVASVTVPKAVKETKVEGEEAAAEGEAVEGAGEEAAKEKEVKA
ncbi:MAG TPA: 50S ribosomal protein L25 [Syntrophales bacterium]|nr:50S ribosomal protein L25 [Syntrophales bacterium]